MEKKTVYLCEYLKLIIMNKETKSLNLNTIAIALCVLFVICASCSITFYNQWHTTDSYINTENPTTNSADSASISIKFPSVKTE